MASKNSLNCELFFEKASQKTLTTSIPIICTLILGVLLIVLSSMQMSVIVDKRFEEDFEDTTFIDYDDYKTLWREACKEDVIEYLSPFVFEIDNRNLGCPWRPRNSAFRLTIVSIMIVLNAYALFVLFSGKYEKSWPAIYWLNWIIFVMLFVIFILDCDAINTGLFACKDNFTIDGSNPFDVDKCKVTPFVWTVLVDFIAVLVVFCSYKISRYYIFDETERRKSIGRWEEKKNGTSRKSTDGGIDGVTDGATTTTTQPISTPQAANPGMSAYDEY